MIATCKNCVYFSQESAGHTKKNTGYCHLEPPIVVALDGLPYTVWPEVPKENFCSKGVDRWADQS